LLLFGFLVVYFSLTDLLYTSNNDPYFLIEENSLYPELCTSFSTQLLNCRNHRFYCRQCLKHFKLFPKLELCCLKPKSLPSAPIAPPFSISVAFFIDWSVQNILWELPFLLRVNSFPRCFFSSVLKLQVFFRLEKELSEP
jgi:hypothetical protein